MIKFKFNQKKATQAMSVLLRHAGQSKTENYMKLIKILYFADRESLQKSGRPITGDRYFAMDHGPVLSNVLDLIRDRAAGSAEWSNFIATEHKNVHLVNDPGNSELSPFEIDILHRMWDEYKDVDPFELADVKTHELPEYKKNKPPTGSRRDISYEDVLEAVGRTDIESIENDAKQMAILDQLYGQ